MSGLDTSQSITDDASQHAEEIGEHSRPHPDISGKSPVTDEQPAADDDGERPGA